MECHGCLRWDRAGLGLGVAPWAVKGAWRWERVMGKLLLAWLVCPLLPPTSPCIALLACQQQQQQQQRGPLLYRLSHTAMTAWRHASLHAHRMTLRTCPPLSAFSACRPLCPLHQIPTTTTTGSSSSMLLQTVSVPSSCLGRAPTSMRPCASLCLNSQCAGHRHREGGMGGAHQEEEEEEEGVHGER